MPRTARLRAVIVVASVFAVLGTLYLGGSLWMRSAPSEVLAGGNEPPAPRVAPQLEGLDNRTLEAAAAYAGAHGSWALIVSRHDHIVFERYWHGSRFDTLLDAGSFTRVLAALAAGVAVSHRQIGWPDEPIGAFISEWSQDPRGAITVRNLLQMSSGLAPASAQAAQPDLIAAALGEALVAVPGAQRLEQAADPQLLALVIERATHQRYASYLSAALWRRVGAADAWLRLDRPGGTAHADCCLRARQGDWIRIGQLLARDGNYRGDGVIRPGWVTLMRTPVRSDPGYGAFVRLATTSARGAEPYAVPDTFVVEGGGSRLWVVPSMQIAVLCTTAEGRDSGFAEARIPNLIVEGARDYLPPPARPGADVSAIVPGH